MPQGMRCHQGTSYKCDLQACDCFHKICCKILPWTAEENGSDVSTIYATPSSVFPGKDPSFFSGPRPKLRVTEPPRHSRHEVRADEANASQSPEKHNKAKHCHFEPSRSLSFLPVISFFLLFPTKQQCTYVLGESCGKKTMSRGNRIELVIEAPGSVRGSPERKASLRPCSDSST